MKKTALNYKQRLVGIGMTVQEAANLLSTPDFKVTRPEMSRVVWGKKYCPKHDEIERRFCALLQEKEEEAGIRY